ncbi:hypothetical protein FZ025_02685 [Xanthomonas hyacinthi]|uniref:Uncharacterized protein n=1 Tax=Xanthomonas hyacinthi TaxID=56455 RepID=A0A2S7EUD8_9XANT|nr:hypothetical protein [Xanthomonas hyacinthi]KLD73356.1 hypothetical protein Y886_38540 [Xanthomonas hyacinthi DSM 19077]PPU96699.1 hypothetical protein XhyaCFBP1156_14515 [Xanthomonas hyacinthi]QGY75619.1 hypothetical protein FZ025_02685 [Xanthomonas hyacinthi]
MREHLLGVAATHRQTTGGLVCDASVAARQARMAAAPLPWTRLPAASAVLPRVAPQTRADRSAAAWPLLPALRVVSE